jgi:hypothetical protein
MGLGVWHFVERGFHPFCNDGNCASLHIVCLLLTFLRSIPGACEVTLRMLRGRSLFGCCVQLRSPAWLTAP